MVRDHRRGRAADTGRHHRDRNRADGQCACARTLSRSRQRRPALATGEGAVGLPVVPLLGLLAVTPVVALLIGLLLPWAGMACGPALIGHGTISVLLRRWRIPRVIRHVARSLSLVQSVQTQTVTGITLPAWSEIRLR